jgi:hypothetical protein
MKEWCERYQSNVCFEAIHLPVKMKQQMQVLAMVEQLLLHGNVKCLCLYIYNKN